MSENISKANENDYTPVNKYIDEQSRLRKAKSFRMNAISWALLLIAIGLLAVLLAWAYSLLDRHYVLKRVAGVQEKVIQEKVDAAISGGDFKKNAENLYKLKDNVGLTEDNEQLEKELSNEKGKNEKLQADKDSLSSEIADLQMKIDSEKFIQEDLMKNMKESFGDKISELESEKLALLNEKAKLQEELKNSPDSSELIKKIDELEKQGKGMGNLRYFSHKNIKLKNYNLTVKTRFHFEDVRKKPNKIECYINFNTATLADLELGTEKANFNVNSVYSNKGFNKQDFLNIKKKDCSWNYFN